MALGDAIADIHMNFFKLTGNLCANIDVLFGFELTLRGDDLLDIGASYDNRAHRRVLRPLRGAAVPVPTAGYEQQNTAYPMILLRLILAKFIVFSFLAVMFTF